VRGDAPHVRKFMVCPGRYCTALESPEVEGELVFWGEWEAASRVNSGDGFEAHRPIAPSPDQHPRGVPQNTDPFVFGDRFLYTFCRQTPRARRVHELAPGSVIVFGSVLHHRFVCDTVLVVAEAFAHTRANWRAVLEGQVPSEFVLATLEPMYAWRPPEDQRFTLYLGATPQSPIDGMFSFVPCQPAERGRFERPPVEAVSGLSAANRRAIAFNDWIPAVEVADRWRQLVQAVLTQGLALGTKIELPQPVADGSM
jgi:hypothetical protein